MSRVLVPVRYAAWLAGELGKHLSDELRHGLELPDVSVTRLPRGLLVESSEATGPFVEAVERATRALEADVKTRYPVFHNEMGPVWTGTLQVVFPVVEA